MSDLKTKFARIGEKIDKGNEVVRNKVSVRNKISSVTMKSRVTRLEELNIKLKASEAIGNESLVRAYKAQIRAILAKDEK